MKLLLLLLSLSCVAYGQHKELAVGYADRYDSLPRISFEKTSQESYEQLTDIKQLRHPAPRGNKNEIVLATGKGNLKLKKYKEEPAWQDGFRGYRYAGYFPMLKMHALLSFHTAEHMGFSELVLVDSSTSNQYAIVSVGDAAVELPLPSPGGQYLVYYYNAAYERNSSFTGLLKVDSSNHAAGRLKECMSYETRAWAVENIRWIDDRSFIVKAFTAQGQARTRQYEYYRAKIGSGSTEVDTSVQEKDGKYYYPFADKSYVLEAHEVKPATNKYRLRFSLKTAAVLEKVWDEELELQQGWQLQEEDVNGDGNKDLFMYMGTGSRSSDEFHYLFIADPGKNSLVRVVGFESIPNPHFDKKHKVIIAYGFAGKNYYSIYRISDENKIYQVGSSFEDTFEGDKAGLDAKITQVLNSRDKPVKP